MAIGHKSVERPGKEANSSISASTMHFDNTLIFKLVMLMCEIILNSIVDFASLQIEIGHFLHTRATSSA